MYYERSALILWLTQKRDELKMMAIRYKRSGDSKTSSKSYRYLTASSVCEVQSDTLDVMLNCIENGTEIPALNSEAQEYNDSQPMYWIDPEVDLPDYGQEIIFSSYRSKRFGFYLPKGMYPEVTEDGFYYSDPVGHCFALERHVDAWVKLSEPYEKPTFDDEDDPELGW